MMIRKFAHSYILGIDGGGNKTLALLADGAGRVVGRGTAGPSNYQVVGVEATYAALDAAVNAALAGVPGVRLAAICLGMAGAGRPQDQAIIQTWAQTRYPGVPALVVHDAQLVLAAGTPAGWGIAIVSGTGSLAYGANPAGQTARAGGWGYLLGDEGSGYAIGLAGLRAVARAADGRAPQTALTGAALSHWGLDGPQGLIGHIYGAADPRTEIARLAPVVKRVGQEGDPAAQVILQAAGRELALAARAVARQLGLDSPIPCALAGGVLVKGEAVSATFCQQAKEFGLQLDPIASVEEPAQGALKLAQELATAGDLVPG